MIKSLVLLVVSKAAANYDITSHRSMQTTARSFVSCERNHLMLRDSPIPSFGLATLVRAAYWKDAVAEEYEYIPATDSLIHFIRQDLQRTFYVSKIDSADNDVENISSFRNLINYTIRLHES